MSEISREQLHAYLDEALSDAETARVEQALRDSEPLRRSLRQAMQERDRGEHSLGAVWRRERLTCPPREQLGSYLLQVLDEGEQDYLDFHLNVIGCPYCVANLADLQALQQEPAPRARERRQRFFQSSAGYLQVCQETKKDDARR
ncbi:MAG TPA: zf-HC2 domain-containing protein [Gemmataceae bacterium]|nr:zf-HC2 domain-containing protein [Gemmataceae bacterium]